VLDERVIDSLVSDDGERVLTFEFLDSFYRLSLKVEKSDPDKDLQPLVEDHGAYGLEDLLRGCAGKTFARQSSAVLPVEGKESNASLPASVKPVSVTTEKGENASPLASGKLSSPIGDVQRSVMSDVKGSAPPISAGRSDHTSSSSSDGF